MPDSEANQQLTTDYTPDEARTVEDRRPETAGQPEDRVGRFVLRERLGEGAFGFVYRAHDPQLDRDVALKVGKPAQAARERTTSATLQETLGQRNQALEQVKQESAARAAATLRIDGLYRTTTYAESLERIGQALKSHDRTMALWEASRLPPDLRGWEADHREWQVHQQNRQLVGHRETVLSLAFSPDGKQLASEGGNPTLNRGEVILWEAAGGKLLHRMEQVGRVRGVAFSPDGQVLASVGGTELRLWNAVTGEQRGRIPTRWVWTESLEFSPDGKMLAAAVNGPGTLPPTLQVWHWPSREERFRLETGMDNPSLAFTPDSTRLVLGNRRGPRVVDLRAGRELLALGSMDVSILAFSPNGTTLVGLGYEGVLWGWDPRLPEQRRVVHGLSKRGRGVAISADGTFLLGIAGVDTQHSEEAEWRGWDYPSGRVRFALSSNGQDAIQAAIRPDGQTFALALKRAVTVHDAATGQETARFDLEKGYTIQGLAWKPDGSRLAVGTSHRGLHLWEPGTPQMQFFPGHNAGVTAVAWNPAGTRLATTSEDGTLKLWDAQTGQVLASVAMGRAGQSVAFTPDGKQIVAGGRSRELRVWSADLTQEIATVPTINFITHLAVDPQGRYVGSGGGHVDLSPELCLWDAQTWKLVHRYPGQNHPVRAVAFSPDGQSLLSMAEDRKIVVWELPGEGRE